MHNCLSIPFDDLLRNGFKTRQTDVRPPASVNTAMQLVAVLFQIQSLQQFGGVSATHLDWTMVPYIRKSFLKHFIDGLRYIEEFNDDDIKDFLNNELDVNIDSIKSPHIYSFIEDISIVDERYKKHSKTYTYALSMTKKEVDQAVEGMYHK